MMIKTPNGETLLEACGRVTVAHARLVRISNMYTQSIGADRKFNDGYIMSFVRRVNTVDPRSRSHRKEIIVVR